MEDGLLAVVQRLVRGRAGVVLGARDLDTLRGAVLARSSATGRLPASYCQWLLAGGDATRPELTELVGLLTNGESYFFRDPGQMGLLRHEVLPALLRARAATRTLRLWSAGCSRGEEPYSLAMLLDELLPRPHAWRIRILGTDIDRGALDHARRGHYHPWLLRAVSEARRERYFRAEVGGYRLDAAMRAMVTFTPLNLVTDPLPAGDGPREPFDLIVCRNVFIYFERDTVRRVADRLPRALAEDGYLLTGHAELMAPPAGMEARRFRESVVYHRRRVEALPPPSPAPPPPAATAPERLDPDETMRAWQAEAQAHADGGRDVSAAACCRRAMERDGLQPWPYRLLAHLAEEAGDGDGAMRLWQQVLYLEPTDIAAHLALAALCQVTAPARARQLHGAALTLLSRLPPETPVEACDATAGELLEQTTAALGMEPPGMGLP
jgi:chemotaxis protein methyltransferase CheR